MKPVCGFLLIVFLLLFENSFGQKENNSVLEKKVTLQVTAETIASILDKISIQAKIFFSYDASLIEADKKKDISVTDQSIRETLDLLFESRFEYKVMGDQVIIAKPDDGQPKKKAEVGDGRPKIILFKGKVADREEKDALPYSNIFVLRKNIGTVSNNDGEFILKVPESMSRDTIVVSCLGYRQQIFPISQLADKDYSVALEPNSVQLKEIRVTVVNPEEIVNRILAKIPINYGRETEVMTSFYREVLKQDNKYIGVAEALMEIRKASYDNVYTQDKVKVIRGRKSDNVRPFQFVDFKIQGGPYYITKLDVVKTLDSFLDPEFRDMYKYTMEGVIDVDNRATYLLSFKPKEKSEDADYEGKLYVDMSSLALVRAEFCLSKAGLKYAREALIRKKPKDFYVRPFDVEYKVSYRRSENKWHLSTARASIKFRVKSKQDRVNSVFHSESELLITDFRPDDKNRFRRDELFRSDDIFTEVISSYNDGYWGDYNTIKPSEELRKSLENYTMKSDSLFKNENANPINKP